MKKKVIRTLLICIVIGCVLTSVYFLWPREKQVYELGTNITDLPQAEELAWWNGDSDFQDETAPKTVTIIWQGKEYQGIYEKSSYLPRMSFLVDEYRGDEILSLIIRRDNGSIEYLSLNDKSSDAEDNTAKTDAEREEIAKDYAGQFVSLEDYRMEVTELALGGDNVGAYQYSFTRYIHGRKTTDFVWVRLKPDGQMINISVGDTNAFSKIIVKWKLSSFEDVDVMEMLKQATEASGVTGIELRDEWYAVTPKGEPVLYVLAELTCEDKDKDETGSQSAVFIIK